MARSPDGVHGNNRIRGWAVYVLVASEIPRAALNRRVIKPLLQEAKLAKRSPLLLRIGAVSDKLGRFLDGADEFGFALGFK